MFSEPFGVKDRYFFELQLSINQDTKAQTLGTQTINTAVRNLILIGDGQSNMADVGPSSYSPSNGSKLDQFNMYDGAIYTAADALLGCSYPKTNGAATYGPGNVLLRLADQFAASLFDRVIICAIAQGATTAANHGTGYLANIYNVLAARLAARGIVPGGTGLSFAVCIGQGEQDCLNGTSQVNYATEASVWINNIRNAGFSSTNCPIFFAQMSYQGGTTSANVTNAQAGLVDHPNGIWAGPNGDSLTGLTNRQADLTHFNNTGMASFATAWKTAMGLYGAPFA